MVCLPCQGDQIENARLLEKSGCLINLQWHTTCREDRQNEISIGAGHIHDAVTDILQDLNAYKWAAELHKTRTHEESMSPWQAAGLILKTADLNFPSECMQMIQHRIPF